MTRRRLGSTVTALALLALLALAAAAGATAADDAATARQAQNETNATPEAWFATDRVAVEHGQVAAIDVRLNNTDEATVVVGSNASTYRLEATVTDGDGDGEVGLQFDTATAGSPDGSPVAAFHDADSATVHSKTNLGDGLATAGYSLQLYLGEPSGEPEGASILVIDDDGTPTTTPPPTSGPTSTDPTTTDSTTVADTGSPVTTDGQAGFGPVVALVGVLAAALLATRR